MRYFAANTPTNCETGENCTTNLPNVAANADTVQNLLATVFGALAAVAVIVIVLAAISFITHDGDTDKIMRARKTIIYALLGLAIAILAEAIVFTVLGRL